MYISYWQVHFTVILLYVLSSSYTWCQTWKTQSLMLWQHGIPWHWDLECMVDGFDPKITRPMFKFSDLGQPRVLSFSERLVNKLNQLSWSTKIDRIYSLFLCSGKNQSIGSLSLLVIDSYINNLIDFSMYYLWSISLMIFFSNNPCLCSFV